MNQRLDSLLYLTLFCNQDIFYLLLLLIYSPSWSEKGRHNSVRIKDQHLHFKEVVKNRYKGKWSKDRGKEGGPAIVKPQH